jgi:uncharacterized protein (TIGR03382 family)
MAFDGARGVVVLFGGFINAANGETWEWAGPIPAILQHPNSQTVAPGQTAIFSVNATGPGTLGYIWGKDNKQLTNGGAISGSDRATLTINPVAAEDAGVYVCFVTNSCGNTQTRTASLTVDPCKPLDAAGDCNANGVLDSCEIAGDTALDADSDGGLDTCEPLPATACGACGAGTATMMPLAVFGLSATARRRRPRRVLFLHTKRNKT